MQPPVDPAVVTPATAAKLALRYPKPLRQLAKQQCFFDGGKAPTLRARQHTHNGLRQVTRPALDRGSIAPKPAQRRHPAIAVDQHQPLTVLGVRTVQRGPNHNARHDLTVAFDAAGQLLHGWRFDEPRAGKAQLQHVQVDI